jgi:phospholipase/carboxylesterase
MTPHGLSGGRAWWLLNMAKLLEATEKGTFDELRAEKPDGLEDAAEKLAGAIAVMRSSWPTCQDRLLLGGFSQGAMMSMEVSTQKLDEPPIGMALFSGALINEASWRSGASKIAETAIFQSHGTLDNVLPFQTGEWLREMLESSDCNVDFIAFDGFHEIPAPAIAGMLRAFGSETE